MNVDASRFQSNGADDRPDVFLCFSGQDRDALQPVVDELRSRALKVWWSSDLVAGSWPDEIPLRLQQSRHVIAIISPNANKSARDYIFVELEMARAANKLIPFVVGNDRTSYAYRGMIERLQCYYFEDLDKILGTPAFEKVIALRGGTTKNANSTFSVTTSPDAAQRIDNWYSTLENRFGRRGQIHLYAMAIAVAIFEHGPVAEVEALAHELITRLSASECNEKDPPLEADFPQRTRTLLTMMECEVVDSKHPVHNVGQSIVRFVDRERGTALLRFTWFEFGRRQADLQLWLSSIADRASSEGKMRLGYALGALAQHHFIDVFDQILRPWLMSNSKGRQDVADIALAAAAFDAGANDATRKIISGWAEQGTIAERKVAVRLACGFAGSRMPGLAIETLQTTARDGEQGIRGDLLRTMEESLKGLFAANANNADNSLFDVNGLIVKLASWATNQAHTPEATDDRIRANPYPLILVLFVLGDLPILKSGTATSELSLESLMSAKDTRRMTAAVFEAALERFQIGTIKIRNIARRVLLDWIVEALAETSTSGFDQRSADRKNILCILESELLTCASTDDDRGRIEDLFEPLHGLPTASERRPLDNQNKD